MSASSVYRLVVLLPNPNSLSLFYAWRNSLDCIAVPLNAFIPLFVAEKPLSAVELTKMAKDVRNATLANSGIIRSSGLGIAEIQSGFSLIGTCIDFDFSCGFCEAVTKKVLSAAIISDTPSPFLCKNETPEFSLSSLALANMVIRKTEYENSFEWKTGKLFWLPPVKNSKALQ